LPQQTLQSCFNGKLQETGFNGKTLETDEASTQAETIPDTNKV